MKSIKRVLNYKRGLAMDINFRIIWFEDVDEWFNTLSRRMKKHITKKNFKVHIDRVKSVGAFDIEAYNIKDYDLLVVDYELEKEYVDGKAEPAYGNQIIKLVRDGKFVNDVLFYSSHGFQVIDKVMKNENLQGVFIADRDNGEFFDTAKALVDKAVRRTENIVNIRGVVMEHTSELDTKIKNIISSIWVHLGGEEEKIAKDIKKKILEDNEKAAKKLIEKYDNISKDNIEQLLEERDFTAYRQARLLNWCISSNDSLEKMYKEAYRKFQQLPEASSFFVQYKKDVINYRNALAHVKNHPDSNGDVYVGEINGRSVVFDQELCNKLRKTLIVYERLFDEMQQFIEKQL